MKPGMKINFILLIINYLQLQSLIIAKSIEILIKKMVTVGNFNSESVTIIKLLHSIGYILFPGKNSISFSLIKF